MLVARTDPDAPEHKGLTYFLMDIEQDKIQCGRCAQITGEAQFNELFIEDARIPDENVIGGVGNGWKVALTTLMNRAGPAFASPCNCAAPDPRRRHRGRRGARQARRPAHRRRDRRAQRPLRGHPPHGLEGPDQGHRAVPAGPTEGSLVKWLWSETNQHVTQLAADVVGAEALTAGTGWSYELLRARGNTIEGGTTRSSRTSSPSGCSDCPAEGRGLRRGNGLWLHRRPARDPAHRPRPARRPRQPGGAENAEAGRHDHGLWKELSELGWPGIAVTEEHGGQGLGTVELAILSEELGRNVAPVAFLPSAMAAAIISAAG